MRCIKSGPGQPMIPVQQHFEDIGTSTITRLQLHPSLSLTGAVTACCLKSLHSKMSGCGVVMWGSAQEALQHAGVRL